MCHRFNEKASQQDVARHFDAINRVIDFDNSDDFYPLKDVLAVRLDRDGERELVTCNWGLLPFWWKPSARSKTAKSFQRMTFNARGESIHEKPAFREAFKFRRCLIPWTEFFERDYYFAVIGAEVSTFAGLWESWRDPESGERVETCTVVTCAANELVEQYHPKKRMPLILNDDDSRRRWLDPDVVERPPLEFLIAPFPADNMKHWAAAE